MDVGGLEVDKRGSDVLSSSSGTPSELGASFAAADASGYPRSSWRSDVVVISKLTNRRAQS